MMKPWQNGVTHRIMLCCDERIDHTKNGGGGGGIRYKHRTAKWLKPREGDPGCIHEFVIVPKGICR